MILFWNLYGKAKDLELLEQIWRRIDWEPSAHPISRLTAKGITALALWGTGRDRGQQNSTESTETDPHKVIKATQQRKVAPQQRCRSNWTLTAKWELLTQALMAGVREGTGNSPQDSCLENPMDRGAWRATVHGVARVRHDWATAPAPPTRASQDDPAIPLLGTHTDETYSERYRLHHPSPQKRYSPQARHGSSLTVHQ